MKYTPIICAGLIAVMAMYANYKGIDGKVFAVAATIIGGIGGYKIRELFNSGRR